MADARWVSASGTNLAKNGTWPSKTDTGSADSDSGNQGWENVGETSTPGSYPTAIPSATTDTGYIRKTQASDTGNEYIVYPLDAPNDVSSSLALWSARPAAEIKNFQGGGVSRIKIDLMVQHPVNSNAYAAQTPQLNLSGYTDTSKTWHEGSTHRVPTLLDGYGDVNLDAQGELIPHSVPLAMKIWDTSTKTPDNIYEVWEAGMLLEYTTKPTTSIGSVTGLNSSTAPIINHTFADTDGGSHDYTHVVIHTATGLTNPALSGYVHNAIYDSPELALKVGAGSIYREADDSISTLEPGTTYYAYVRVGKIMENGVVVMGNWTAATSFTITSDKPATPTLTANNNTTYEKVLCTITDAGNRLSWENCSFENGVADWIPDANVSTLSTVNTAPTADHGDWSLKVTPTGTSNATVICGQLIDVKPSTSYGITARIRKQTGTNAVGVAIRWYDANGATISTSTFSSTTPSTSAWTTTTTTASSPATAVYAAVAVRATTPASSADHMYVDKVAFSTGTAFSPGLSNARYELQRSYDQLNWVDVANTPMYRPLWAQGRISDYGANRNTTAYYRARLVGEAAGVLMQSDYATANDTIPNNTYWRISVAPLNPIPRIVIAQVTATNVATLTTSIPHNFQAGDTVIVTNTNLTFNYNATYTVRSVESETEFTVTVVSGTVAAERASGYAEKIVSMANVKLNGLQQKMEEALGVFHPLGNGGGAVTVSSGVYNDDGSFTITTATADEWTALEPLLKSDNELVVSAPYGTTYWMKLTDRQWETRGTNNALVREVQCDWVGVTEH